MSEYNLIEVDEKPKGVWVLQVTLPIIHLPEVERDKYLKYGELKPGTYLAYEDTDRITWIYKETS